ncbi:hypothetical protein DPEC_G00245580 [Dallia pectoralis]|uniref:Uncharacterized protein n=1 Tax=Dallia pectoralis TaxID=75939 RepID=A0ACC2FVV8_DALPE|nr:hypothetical protein DPEC_G00245580 [Dallia pectoralis]
MQQTGSPDGGVVMAGLPMGKMLLRNVIRHTDAHNKIQEESEMWKLRGMEKRPSTSHRAMLPDSNSSRSSMHCDRVDDVAGYRSGKREQSSGQDEKDARYWTKKLYEFESNDPDRWGHSGFKELYPEEFKSDGESDSGIQNNHRRKKKSMSTSASSKSKNLKKSAKKKKKKKDEKKRSKSGESDDEFSSNQSDSIQRKQKSKRRKKKRKTHSDRSKSKDKSSSEGKERHSTWNPTETLL